MKKYSYIIIILVMGLLLDMIGAFFKIAHLEIGVITGNVLLILGMSIKAFAAILFIIELLKNDKSSVGK